MALIIQIVSVERDVPRKEARRLESIIEQEKLEAFVVATTVLPEIISSWGATQLPVVMINGAIVWQGEAPPEDLVRAWIHWPKTLDEAVEQVLSLFGNIPDDPLAQMTLGTTIRNSLGLRGANKDLLRSCGSESMTADDAAALILRKARERQEL
jgi:Thioredoxin domain